MKSSLARRLGLPALFLTGTMVGLGIAGMAQSPQPHMQAALNALNTAKAELTLAVADKGGHRVHALNYVNSAIAETKLGMNYSATH